jgi:SAM-dependent methyltransferase
MSVDTCRVCGSQGPFVPHVAREMLYGTREDFDYLECKECGSLQIKDIPEPAVLARHYPENYYSFNASNGTVKRWLETRRDNHVFGRRSPIGAAVARKRPDTTLPLLARAGVQADHRIIDVGCGQGHLLDRLARMGFANLLGVDPFVDGDTRTAAGVEIRKTTLDEVTGEYDVVMFHHSLEHVPDPTSDLTAARNLLKDGGVCIVRLPTTDSEGWEHHGVHWSSLDPPRHLVLPSRHGMVEMGERAGLEHVETVDDSYGGQYANSELYSRGISASDPEAAIAFTPADHSRFQALADKANHDGHADQAMFLFRAPSTR